VLAADRAFTSYASKVEASTEASKAAILRARGSGSDGLFADGRLSPFLLPAVVFAL
jgi:hypothetical protein